MLMGILGGPSRAKPEGKLKADGILIEMAGIRQVRTNGRGDWTHVGRTVTAVAFWFPQSLRPARPGLASSSVSLSRDVRSQSTSSGGGGIQTHGTAKRFTGFRDRPFQPLRHPSRLPDSLIS